MANISATNVKALRELTGAGMMDCKMALTETDGDIDAAVDWLRTKGLAAAAKKAGRIAAEGLVGIAVSSKRGVVVEVNSETDFVARNDLFQELVITVSQIALKKNGNFEDTGNALYTGQERTVREQVQHMVGTIGENIQFRRCDGLSVDEGVVAFYMHNAVKPFLGKIGVLVALESQADIDRLEGLGRSIAMHVAAANPLSVSIDSLDPEIVERERQVLAEQARQSGKPEGIVEKMTEGRLRKFYEDSVLNEQIFVVDGENKISKILKQASEDFGSDVKITGFLRFALGEGIDKELEDFASEVAAQVAK